MSGCLLRQNNHSIFKKDKKGYVLYKAPEHPSANKDGYVIYHRYIMEKSIGRCLDNKEVVHHLDENVDNNIIDNLLLLPDARAHRIIHNLLQYNTITPKSEEELKLIEEGLVERNSVIYSAYINKFLHYLPTVVLEKFTNWLDRVNVVAKPYTKKLSQKNLEQIKTTNKLKTKNIEKEDLISVLKYSNIEEASKYFNCSTWNIYKYINLYKLRGNKQLLNYNKPSYNEIEQTSTRPTKQDLEEYIAKGYTVPMLSYKYSIPSTTLRRIIKKLGVKYDKTIQSKGDITLEDIPVIVEKLKYSTCYEVLEEYDIGITKLLNRSKEYGIKKLRYMKDYFHRNSAILYGTKPRIYPRRDEFIKIIGIAGKTRTSLIYLVDDSTINHWFNHYNITDNEYLESIKNNKDVMNGYPFKDELIDILNKNLSLDKIKEKFHQVDIIILELITERYNKHINDNSTVPVHPNIVLKNLREKLTVNDISIKFKVTEDHVKETIIKYKLLDVL